MVAEIQQYAQQQHWRTRDIEIAAFIWLRGLLQVQEILVKGLVELEDSSKAANVERSW